MERKDMPFDVIRKTALKRDSLLLLIVAILFFVEGCGDTSQKEEGASELTVQSAYKLDGGAATESYLAISSSVDNEAAVHVLNGGSLIMTDSKIIKTADPNIKTQTDSDVQDAEGRQQGRQPGGTDGAPEGQAAGGPAGRPGGQQGTGSGGMPGDQAQGQMPGGITVGQAGGQMTEGGMPGQAGGASETVNSGVYAIKDGAVMMSNCAISTDSSQGKGLYATGHGSSIAMSNGAISTLGDYSHGVFVTYGGSISLNNVSINTAGKHCSVLATDHGGGTVTVIGGTYTALGSLSAGIYSTGNVTVSNADVRAMADNAAVIDCDGQIYLNNVNLEGSQNGIMVHNTVGQAMTAYITISGGTINARGGDALLIQGSNEVVHIAVKGSASFNASTGNFLNAVKSATVNLVSDGFNYANGQSITGNIACDDTGTINARVQNNSTLTGAVNTANAKGSANIFLDSISRWNVTADSYLTSLSDAGGISGDTVNNIYGNGFTVYYDNDKNPDLGGRTYLLNGGGSLKPVSYSERQK